VADGVEFVGTDVANSADISSAEGIDDEVEAVAGVVTEGSVYLVARFSADGSVLVVAVGEGGACDLRSCDGAWRLR